MRDSFSLKCLWYMQQHVSKDKISQQKEDLCISEFLDVSCAFSLAFLYLLLFSIRSLNPCTLSCFISISLFYGVCKNNLVYFLSFRSAKGVFKFPWEGPLLSVLSIFHKYTTVNQKVNLELFLDHAVTYII